jgi:hypothetical protein
MRALATIAAGLLASLVAGCDGDTPKEPVPINGTEQSAIGIAAGIEGALAVYDDGWIKYRNARFGTLADIPSAGFTWDRAPDNGDGQSWIGNDGGKITVAAGFLPENWDELRDLRLRWAVDDGVNITYAPTGRDWFVISGRKGDNIYYTRTMRSEKCPDVAHNVYFEYPAERKSDWDNIVLRASNSLSAGPALQCVH